jgi:hypothetical protein
MINVAVQADRRADLSTSRLSTRLVDVAQLE